MRPKTKTLVALGLEEIERAKQQAALGERSARLPRDFQQRLDCYVRPFFGTTAVHHIDSQKLENFRSWLAKRKIKSTTILPIESFVSVCLKRAARQKLIAYLPEFPTRSRKASPRPAFSRADYRSLLTTLKKIEAGKPAVVWKGNEVDWEMRAIVTFMVNSFLRPGDIFVLKNEHVQVLKDEGTTYLRLDPPSSKGHDAPVITMPIAAEIYRRTLERHGKAGFGKPGDYVFMPSRLNRSYAHEIVRRQFQLVLNEAKLSTSVKGVAHTLYSLRHTSIVFRLLNSKDLDLLTLARNCRTSVEMIDRFYASSLTAEMNRDKLHSFRRETRYAA